MNRPRHSTTLLGAVMVIVFLIAAGSAPSAGASASAGRTRVGTPTVLILAEQLDWSNSPATLHHFARADLSLHSAGSEFQAEDGFLTVGKGRRAVGLGARFTPSEMPAAPFVVPGWDAIVAHDKRANYGGHPGEFAAALHHAGVRWAAVTDDPLAMLAFADTAGTVRNAVTGGAPAVQAALATGAQVVVAATSTPTALPALLAAAHGDCTIVASVSSPTDYAHLGVFAASPECGLGTKGLSSASTKQPPFVALVDVAPTVLSRIGIHPPSAMIGEEIHAARSVSARSLRSEDVRAHRSLRAHNTFVWFFVAAVSVAAGITLVRRSPSLVVLAMASALPVSSFLIMLIPWTRFGGAGACLACAAIAIALGSVCAAASRGHPMRCLSLVSVVTVLVLVGDAIRGGTLELDAPFGNSPIIAGRFDGIGNIAFGFSMGALLVIAGVACSRWGRRAVPWVAGVLVLFAICGAPPLADKVGLVPVWVPSAGVFLFVANGRRLQARWLAVFGVCAVLLVGGFALVDLTHGASSQSHLARWLSSGDILDTVKRKFTSMLQSFRGEPLRWMLPVPLLAVWRNRHSLWDQPWSRAMVLSVLTAATLGSVLDDSGIAVGAAVLATAWPALAWFATTRPVATSRSTTEEAIVPSGASG